MKRLLQGVFVWGVVSVMMIIFYTCGVEFSNDTVILSMAIALCTGIAAKDLN